MKKSAIYIIYEWLWHKVDSGVDYYLSASGQGVDMSMDHVWTVFQQSVVHLHLVRPIDEPH